MPSGLVHDNAIISVLKTDLVYRTTSIGGLSNAKRAPLHPYKGKLNPFYPMDETTRGAFQKVDSINYWKIRGEEILGGK